MENSINFFLKPSLTNFINSLSYLGSTLASRVLSHLVACDENKNMNTMCSGACCTRVFVGKTNNAFDCMMICKKRKNWVNYSATEP